MGRLSDMFFGKQDAGGPRVKDMEKRHRQEWKDLEKQQEANAMDIVNAAVAEAEAQAPAGDNAFIRGVVADTCAQVAPMVDRTQCTSDAEYRRHTLNTAELVLLSNTENLQTLMARSPIAVSVGSMAQAVVEAFMAAKLESVGRLYGKDQQVPKDFSKELLGSLESLRALFEDGYRHMYDEVRTSPELAGTIAGCVGAIANAESVMVRHLWTMFPDRVRLDAAMVAVFSMAADKKRELCRQVYGS